jgi:hypothetical protein
MGLWDKIKNYVGMFSAGSDYYNKLLHLDDDEKIVFSTGGRYLVEIERAKDPGAVEKWLCGDATVCLGEQYLLVITDKDRLAVADMVAMDETPVRHFGPADRPRVEEQGYLMEEGGVISKDKHYKQPGPTGKREKVKILRFTPQQGEPFLLFAVESAIPQIVQWSGETPTA